jgi:predicted DNA-binding protein with PD1-like motif
VKYLGKEKINTYAFRLKPGQDLKQSIVEFVEKNQIKAGWIAATVGSLTRYNIRFANRDSGSVSEGHFEIISCSGLLSVEGSHLHLSLADSNGVVIGGHMLDGCIVYTTAEIVIQSTNAYRFSREKDGSTPYKELKVVELN